MTISYTVKPLENGYTIEHSYKVPAEKEYDGYTYQSKKYMYAKWSDVIEWIADHPIVIPQED